MINEFNNINGKMRRAQKNYEDNEELIYRIRRRIVELEARINAPHNWTNGELGMFKQEIIKAQIKLNSLMENE